MNCFQDLIGINTACGATASQSGLFINEQPGISSEMLDYIAKPEYSDYLNSWNVVQKNAYFDFSSDFREVLKNRFVLKNHSEKYNAMPYRSTATDVLPNPNLRGYKIKLSCGKNVIYELQKITFFSLNSGSATIEIYDLSKGILLATSTFNIAGGFNTYSVGLKFLLPIALETEIFVSIDLTGLTTQEFAVSFGGDYDTFDCYQCGTNGWSAGYVPTALPAITNNFVDTPKSSFGFTLTANCSFDYIFCEYKDILVNAWKIALCLEIFKHFFVNPKYSQLIASRGAQLQLLADKWQQDYKKYLQLAIEEMQLCGCDCLQPNHRHKQIWN